MREHDVNMFLMANKDYLPEDRLPYLRSVLMNMDDQAWAGLSMVTFKSPVLMLVISLLVGELGVDRFLVGDIALGLGKLLTAGGCGVWWFIDLFLIMNRTREKNWQKLAMFL